MKQVYLDHTATTPLDPRVLEAMMTFFRETFGNASSVHRFGREAKLALEESREAIAGMLGAKYDEVFFTGGGTESDNYALKGVAFAAQSKGRNHVVVSAVEHHAVLKPAEWLKNHGFEVEIIPVDEYGMVDPDDVRRMVRDSTCLISVMHVNNEVGTVEPIRELAMIARERGIVFHSDAVQSVGKIPITMNELGTDILSVSAHKIYGPKGIGAIVIRKGTQIESILQGGAQESKRRAGTENVAFAVGLARAIEICQETMEEELQRMKMLRNLFRKKLTDEFEGILFNGHPEHSLPNIVSISFDSSAAPVDGDALIIGMDLRGIAVTSGSACSSGSLEPSHVLLAMGRDVSTARATVRFSMGRSTTEEDISVAVDALKDVVATMRAKVGV